MFIFRKRLTGDFIVEDQNENKLGCITPKLFGPKYIIKNFQNGILGYTDIRIREPQNPDSTLLGNTEYVLTSAINKEELAIGLPAYDENVDVSILKTLYIKPPLADRITIHLPGADEDFFLCLQLTGRAMISDAGKNICGDIRRLKRGVFSVNFRSSNDPVLLCGIFLFTRYLIKENEPIPIV